MEGIKNLLKHQPRPRRSPRQQKGTVVEKSGRLFLRFYIEEDGRRKKVTERLHDVDTTHFLTKSKKLSPAVDSLRAKRMEEVNAGTERQSSATKISAFWQHTYVPFIEEEKAASTVTGYKRIWNAHLADEFDGKTLAGYSTPDGYHFTLQLKKRGLNRNTIQHIRNLASGIFSEAQNRGLVSVNPWSKVKATGGRAPKKGHAYSLEESIAILNAIERVDGKLLFALVAFMALRPSEAAGLKLSHVDADQVRIREAVVSGIPGELKTEDTERDLLLIEPVKSLIDQLRAQNGFEADGYLLTGRKGRPINSSAFADRVIRPAVLKAGLKWHGLYAGRRGCATRLTKITGNLNAAYATLGNSYQVTAAHYVKPLQDASDAGLRAIEHKMPVQSSKE